MPPYVSLFARCCDSVITFSRFSSSLRKLGAHVTLEKLLRQRGAGSRNEVKDLLKLGRVTTANGEVLRRHRLSLRPDTVLHVDGTPLLQIPLLAVLYKPIGIQCSMKDNWERPDLSSIVKDIPILADKHPVGRLDADTSGLLLFSSSGSLTHMLVDPANAVEREYEALVLGDVHDSQTPLKQRLSEGVQTSDGIKQASLVECETYDIATSQQLLSQLKLPYSHSEERQQQLDPPQRVDISTLKVSRVVVVVREGKYRMVRRILANSGYPVLSLHRTRFGGIQLQSPDAEEKLQPGMARLVTAAEYDWAVRLHDNAVGKLKYKKTKDRLESRALCKEFGVSNVDELHAAMNKMNEATGSAKAAPKAPTKQQQEIITQALSSTAAKPLHSSKDSSTVRAGSVTSVNRSYIKPSRLSSNKKDSKKSIDKQ